MAKRSVFLHLGLSAGNALDLDYALRDHATALHAQQVHVAGRDRRALELAEIELLRTHRKAGLRRREVEGAWAAICRRAWKRKGRTVVVSEALGSASSGQIDLLLDGLAGMKVHLVVTTTETPGMLPAALSAWGQRIKPSRQHVVNHPVTADPVGHAWWALASTVGYDAPALGMEHPKAA